MHTVAIRAGRATAAEVTDIVFNACRANEKRGDYSEGSYKVIFFTSTKACEYVGNVS